MISILALKIQFYSLILCNQFRFTFQYNNKKKMSQIDQQLSQLIPHYNDRRSERQKELTNKLAQKLTQLNLERVKLFNKHLDNEILYSEHDLQKYQKYLFVCIHGIPPFEKEFDHLYIPGQKLQIYITGFEPDLTQQQIISKLKYADLQIQADQMYKKIKQVSTTKPLIFAYHSFGTFVASFYFSKYYQEQKSRIKGIIQLGPVPITAYTVIKDGLRTAHTMQRDAIIENSDFIWESYKKQSKKMQKQRGFTLLQYRNKYLITIILLAYKSKTIHQAFQYNRNLPKVVKLFIYGSKDMMCQDALLNQKATYYSYNQKTKLNPEYQAQLLKQYQNLYGKKIKSIQDRFVFRMQGGGHSVHMQKKYTKQINLAMKEYLQFIQNVKVNQ